MVQSIFFTTILACSGIVSGAYRASRPTQAESTPYVQQNQKPSSATEISDRAMEYRKADNRKLATSSQGKFYSKSEIDQLLNQAGQLDTEVCRKLEASCQKMEPVYMEEEGFDRDYCMPNLTEKCPIQRSTASKLY